MFEAAPLQKAMAFLLENKMSESPRKKTLGEMLEAGERPFVDKEKLRKNLIAISNHSDSIISNLVLPASPGRPRRGQEVDETEAITIRVPKSNLQLLMVQANEMHMSRNRLINISISRQLQDPIEESELSPSITSNIITFKTRDISVERMKNQIIRTDKETIIRLQQGHMEAVSPAFPILSVVGVG